MENGLAREIFEGCPAPTLIVDADVRVLRANLAARVLFGRRGEAKLATVERGGEAIGCIHAERPGGCGRQLDCADCVIRNSVRQALAGASVHRARTFMRVRDDRGEATDICVLVSASAVRDGETGCVLLSLENVSDVQLRDAVIRAERALDRAHADAVSLARFPEENPDPVLRVDADRQLVYANTAARSALADRGLSVGAPIPPELAAAAAEAMAGQRPVSREITSGGRTFDLSFCPAGEQINVYGRDVTERNRATEQLAAEKDRLAVTLASIGDAVIATDEQMRITLVNPVAEALTGWKADECIGRPIDEVFTIISEDTRDRAANPVARALRERVVVGLANHTALVARDGVERPIADSAAPIRDATGRVAGAVLVFRDQTNERRAEQALRDSEQRIRLKLESILSPEGNLGKLELADIVDVRALELLMREFNALAGIPVALVDVAGKVLVGVGWQDVCTKFHRVHPESCKHCVESDTQLSAGVAPGEIRLYRCKNNMWDVATPITIGGHHLGNVFMGQFFFDDEPVDRELFRRQAERYRFDERAYLEALDAVPRLSRESVSAAMGFFLNFAGLLSQSSFSNLKLARSVAERERLMAALRDTKERLETEDRRKNDFLAVLSHELRNPLAPVRNALYILDHAEPEGQQARRAKEIAGRQITHLTRLVDDLLDVTRIARGKVDLRRSRLDLGDLARRTGEDHRALMHERGLAFDVRTPLEPAWVDGDETRLAQVIGNLLQNAAKFTPEGGSVTLSVGRADDDVELRVDDTGSGIEPDLIDAIFEPFVQAKQSLARTEGGLGLGLALVKALTDLHGGNVTASSRGEGAGAQFTIRLPALAGPGLERSPRAPRERAPTRHPRVLVVDDNRDAAESLAELVELFGCEAEVVLDGRRAVQIVTETPPDVILCDLGLPGFSGYDVARTLRADARFDGIQLVAVSGYAQPEDRERALQAGFAAHLPKPPDPRVLERLLGRDRACS